MDRKDLGQKIVNAFALEGLITASGDKVAEIEGEIASRKAEVARIKGLEAEIEGFEKDLSAEKKNFTSLKNEYEQMVSDIESAGASMPKFDVPRPPSHLKF
jgi:predicted  nucleic acid-binding Zn-ribbon protein